MPGRRPEGAPVGRLRSRRREPDPLEVGHGPCWGCGSFALGRGTPNGLHRAHHPHCRSFQRQVEPCLHATAMAQNCRRTSPRPTRLANVRKSFLACWILPATSAG